MGMHAVTPWRLIDELNDELMQANFLELDAIEVIQEVSTEAAD